MIFFGTPFHKNSSGELSLDGTVEMFLANFGYIYWKKPFRASSMKYARFVMFIVIVGKCLLLLIFLRFNFSFLFFFPLLVSKVFQLFFSRPPEHRNCFECTFIPLLNNRVATSTANLILPRRIALLFRFQFPYHLMVCLIYVLVASFFTTS